MLRIRTRQEMLVRIERYMMRGHTPPYPAVSRNRRRFYPGLLAALVLFSLTSVANVHAAIAERPISGGLGITFGQVVPNNALGAHLLNSPEEWPTPDNRNFSPPIIEPGGYLPWRYFSSIVLPRPLRGLPHNSYIMVNDGHYPLRVVTSLEHRGCGEKFEWLEATLAKKYQLIGDANKALTAEDIKQGIERKLRITFSGKQIDISCGRNLRMAYLDFKALRAWGLWQRKNYQAYQRAQATEEKRSLILERRRAVLFADTFTIGDRFSLDGAFGIMFKQPFAKNSTQNFPTDIPFYVGLPNLPAEFSNGDIKLVIGPERLPIVIRGKFRNLSFEKVDAALRAKYGSPMKGSERHVIHKIDGNHAILKRLPNEYIEVAFIDTVAQSIQRERLWQKESEGL